MSRSARLLLITGLLVGIGLLFVFEASVSEAFNLVGDPLFFLKQQAVRGLIGLVLLTVASFVPLKWWQASSYFFYGFCLLLLVSVFIPGIGLELNGAHRWISLFGFVLQPVELMKLACILFFSSWLTKHQRVAPWLVLTALPAILVIAQPDLGSLLVLLAICFSLYFVAGGSMKTIMTLVLGGLVFLSIAVIASPYRLQRVTTYMNPDKDPLGAGFHVKQITLALGSGSWIGQGLGNSKQKYAYIPEASTDSIFAIIAEEIGFIGSVVVFLLFIWHFNTGLSLVRKTKSGSFEYLVALGILIWIIAQVILNLSAVVALVPLTGVPLPFFSYGGSSLIMVLLATGILVSIDRSVTREEQVKNSRHKKL